MLKICFCNTKNIFDKISLIDSIITVKKYNRLSAIYLVFVISVVSLLACGSPEKKNREIAALYYTEILTEKNTELIDEIIAPGIRFYRPDHKGDRSGIDAFRHFVKLNHDLSPDLNVEIGDVIAEGDKVAVRYTISGTYTKSGEKYTSEGISILQIENGRITKIWENADDLNFLIQIGLLEGVDYPHKHEPE